LTNFYTEYYIIIPKIAIMSNEGEKPKGVIEEILDKLGSLVTATFGSELAPQVQFLREIRDNTVLSTTSGASFMTAFNTFYYPFSPAVADLERQNPIFLRKP